MTIEDAVELFFAIHCRDPQTGLVYSVLVSGETWIDPTGMNTCYRAAESPFVKLMTRLFPEPKESANA